MNKSEEPETTAPQAKRRQRPKLDYKRVYRKRKANKDVYEHIKEYNRNWIARHPEVNARNQKLTRQRRAQRKLEERQDRYPGRVTVKEAAKLLGVTRQRVHQLIQANELGEVERNSNRVLIRHLAIDRYLELKRPIK